MNEYILFLGGVLVGSLGTMLSFVIYVSIGMKKDK